MTRTPVILLCALALGACASDDWDPAVLARGGTRKSAEQQRRGRESYQMYCAGCHGEQGDGQGPAARFLSPKPRDFRKGRLKFASVAGGAAPRDEDYLRTMNHGLTGTAMPSWALLPQEESLDIVMYLRSFGPQGEIPSSPVPLPADPFAKRPEKGIAEGELVYHGLAACTSCHPAYLTKDKIREHMKEADVPFSGFRKGLYESEPKESEWGEIIRPPDFLVDQVKSASSRDDLARVIAAGVGGTAMPSWGETLTPKQLWGLAYYVQSLVDLRGSDDAAAMKARLLAQPSDGAPTPTP